MTNQTIIDAATPPNDTPAHMALQDALRDDYSDYDDLPTPPSADDEIEARAIANQRHALLSELVERSLPSSVYGIAQQSMLMLIDSAHPVACGKTLGRVVQAAVDATRDFWVDRLELEDV